MKKALLAVVVMLVVTACSDDAPQPVPQGWGAVRSAFREAARTAHAASVLASAAVAGDVVGPVPTVTSLTPAAETYYPNCADARAAGAAPLHRGDPGYRPALDRDGDGVACDT